MGALRFPLFLQSVLPWLAIIFLLVLFLYHLYRQRVYRQKKNAELHRLSSLQLFGRALAESTDLKQMADLTLLHSTQMLGSAAFYLLVQANGS